MPSLCFTIDLDGDVNFAIPGRIGAGSLDRGCGTSPRFVSSVRGIQLLLGLLEEMSVPATVFAECQTLEFMHDCVGCLDGFDIGLHGLEHEDFTQLSPITASERICRSKEVITDLLGVCPRSFRAPYMKPPGWLDACLTEAGFVIDSSTYAEPSECRAFRTPSGILEVPVLSDSHGGMAQTTYLWPMHEGKRGPGSFLPLCESVPDEGTVVICDHSWHIVEGRSSGVQDQKTIERNLENVREVLEDFLCSGYKPKVMSDFPLLL